MSDEKREPIVIGPSAQRMSNLLMWTFDQLALERLHADECLIKQRGSRDLRCVREDHPTPTSDCTTRDWVTHFSEEDK